MATFCLWNSFLNEKNHFTYALKSTLIQRPLEIVQMLSEEEGNFLSKKKKETDSHVIYSSFN